MSPLCSPRCSSDSFCVLLLFLILCVSASVNVSDCVTVGTPRRLQHSDSDSDSEVKSFKSKTVMATDKEDNRSAKPKEGKTVGVEVTRSKKVSATPIEEKTEVKVKKTKTAELAEGKVKKVKAPIEEKGKKLKVPISNEEKLGKKVDKEKNEEPDAKMKKQKDVEGERKVKPKSAEEEISQEKPKAINETKTLKPKTSITTKALNSTKPLLSNQTKLSNTNTTKTKPITHSPKIDLKKPVSSSITNVKPPGLKKATKSKEAQTTAKKETSKPQKPPSWTDMDDDSSFVSQIRDLPSKFNQIFPDFLKLYETKANKEVTKRYASTVASFISLAFIIIPLVLASLIFHHVRTFFSLQKVLIFIQAYLAIYFSILSLSSLVTGLEPLKFFFETSKSTYLCVMVLQTLAYGLYILLLLMYLVLVFSTDTTVGSKGLGLAQTLLGFAVGVHFYVAVVHRVAMHLPPQTNWKIHGVYAVCFAAVCGFAAAEKRKKAYLEESGQEGKRN